MIRFVLPSTTKTCDVATKLSIDQYGQGMDLEAKGPTGAWHPLVTIFSDGRVIVDAGAFTRVGLPVGVNGCPKLEIIGV